MVVDTHRILTKDFCIELVVILHQFFQMLDVILVNRITKEIWQASACLQTILYASSLTSFRRQTRAKAMMKSFPCWAVIPLPDILFSMVHGSHPTSYGSRMEFVLSWKACHPLASMKFLSPTIIAFPMSLTRPRNKLCMGSTRK